jgi:hypothetical protein
MKKLLDRAEFRAWLEAQGDNVVGKARKCDDCPIVRYLHTRTNAEDIEADTDEFIINDDSYHTPDWASDFIEEIDSTSGVYVRGAYALEVLDGIGE